MIKAKQVYSFTDNVLQLYKTAFPVIEQIPVDLFDQLVRNKETNLYEYYDHNHFIGFLASTTLRNYLYLTFFAIKPEYRNKGYGAQIIKSVINNNPDKIIGLAIEVIDDFSNDNDIKVHRYHFYERLGFKLNDFIVSHKAGTFNVMSTKLVSMEQFKKLADEKVPGLVSVRKLKN